MFKFIASIFSSKPAAPVAGPVDLSWMDLSPGQKAVEEELTYFLSLAEKEREANPTAQNTARVQRAFNRLDNFFYEVYG